MEGAILDVFRLARDGSPTSLERSTRMWIEIVQNPEVLPHLLALIDTVDDAYFRNLAVIMMRQVLEHRVLTPEDKRNVIDVVLGFLVKEKVQSIRNVLLVIVNQLLDPDSIQCLLSFTEKGVLSKDVRMVNAAIDCLLMMETVPFSESVASLIDIGMAVDPPVSAIKLALKEWGQLSAELAVAIWKRTIELVLHFLVDLRVLTELCHVLVSAIDNHTYGDLQCVIETFLPTIGSQEVDPEAQFCLATVVSQALLEMNVQVTDSGFVHQLLERYFALSLCIERDVFTVLCHVLCQSDVSLGVLLDDIKNWLSTKSSRRSALRVLSHCFENGYGCEPSAFTNVLELLGSLVCDDCEEVRSEAAAAIQSLAAAICDKRDFGELPLRIIESLAIQYSADMIEALICIFNESISADGVFDEAIKFLIPLTATADASCLQHVLPCIVSLCEASAKSVNEHFDLIATSMQSIISSDNLRYIFVKGFAVECLQVLLSKCPMKFSVMFDGFVGMLCNLVFSNDQQLQDSANRALSSVFRHHSQLITFPLDELLHKLLEANSTKTLSLACVILDEKPEYYTSYIDTLTKLVIHQLQKQTSTVDASLCRCLALFVDIVGQRCELEPELANGLLTWAINAITTTDEEDVCAEAIGILVELLTYEIGVELTPILTLFPCFFNFSLPCLDGSEYNEEVFPVMGFFMKLVIKKLGIKSCQILQEFSNQILAFCRSQSAELRDLGCQLVGQFVESGSDGIPDETLTNIVNMAVEMVSCYKSPSAVFVLNQCAGAAERIPTPRWTEILQLLLETLTSSPSPELSDNCVNSIGAIAQNTSIPTAVDQYLIPVIQFMPARSDAVENIEMLQFFLWLADKTTIQPVDQFLSVLIRLFSVPPCDLKPVRSQTTLWASLLSVAKHLLQSVGDKFNDLAKQVLNSDEVAFANLQSFLCHNFPELYTTNV